MKEEMPERGGAWPKERGRSTTKHQTTSSRCTPQRSLVAGYSALMQWPGSLKRERMPEPQPSSSTPSGLMPTQSPAQKNTKLKLKSIVQKVPPKQPDTQPTSGWQPDRALPYHSIAEKLEDFMQYIMQSGLMVRDHFIAEIDDLIIFGHERSRVGVVQGKPLHLPSHSSTTWDESAVPRRHTTTWIPPRVSKLLHRGPQGKLPSVVALLAGTTPVLQGCQIPISIQRTTLS